MPAIRTETADNILTITLDRPDALNAFDRAMKEELLAALKSAARDRDVRVVIITGAGRAFNAGQDLKERVAADGAGAGAAADLGTELRERFNPIILAIRRLDKPVVAAVNGVAAGAGCSLVLACDLVIASEDARFLEAFARIGLVPDTGSTWFLPRLIGYARAAEMTFLAEPMDAATAERVGLVNRVVPAARLGEEARALALRLAAAAPLALALTKRALNRAFESDLASQLELEAQLQAVAGRSRDHAEGIAAFIEKRPARFTGE